MKKSVVSAGWLLAVGAWCLAAHAADAVEIGGIHYTLDAERKTAAIVGYNTETPPTVLDVSSVEHDGNAYDVTSVEDVAFL